MERQNLELLSGIYKKHNETLKIETFLWSAGRRLQEEDNELE